MKLVDDLMAYPRGKGYVVDHSDTTMRDYFGTLNIDIEAPVYTQSGGSKGARLRAFLKRADDALAATVLKSMWERRAAHMVAVGEADPVHHAQGRFLTLLQRLQGTGAVGEPPVPLPPPDGAAQDALRAELWRIKNLAPQKRGYEFERFLTRIFSEGGMAPREPFRNVGEQIDGSFLLGHETYLIEAKYEKNLTGAGDLHSFHGKVTSKARWARGLFIAFEGFTNVGLEAFGKGKSIILMGGAELDEALLRRIPLRSVLDHKVRAAVENGCPFNSISDLFKL